MREHPTCKTCSFWKGVCEHPKLNPKSEAEMAPDGAGAFTGGSDDDGEDWEAPVPIVTAPDYYCPHHSELSKEGTEPLPQPKRRKVNPTGVYFFAEQVKGAPLTDEEREAVMRLAKKQFENGATEHQVGTAITRFMAGRKRRAEHTPDEEK